MEVGSNYRHIDFQSTALPPELPIHGLGLAVCRGFEPLFAGRQPAVLTTRRTDLSCHRKRLNRSRSWTITLVLRAGIKPAFPGPQPSVLVTKRTEPDGYRCRMSRRIVGTPYRTRTGVFALKERYPRLLDEGSRWLALSRSLSPFLKGQVAIHACYVPWDWVRCKP